MKKKFNLQLFAEPSEPTPGAEPTPLAEQTADPKQTEPKPDDKGTNKEPEAKYTDADLDKIINQKFAEWQKKQQKAVDEAAKLAGMNAQEKAEHLLKAEQEKHAATQKELDEYKRKDMLFEMSKTARKMLSEDDINLPDTLLSKIVTTDAEETKAAVEDFKNLFKDAVEKAVKEKLRGETPKAGNGATAVSEIDKRIQKYQ